MPRLLYTSRESTEACSLPRANSDVCCAATTTGSIFHRYGICGVRTRECQMCKRLQLKTKSHHRQLRRHPLCERNLCQELRRKRPPRSRLSDHSSRLHLQRQSFSHHHKSPCPSPAPCLPFPRPPHHKPCCPIPSLPLLQARPASTALRSERSTSRPRLPRARSRLQSDIRAPRARMTPCPQTCAHR